MESCANILPTRRNLQRRGLYEGTCCVHCGCCAEDDRHTLLIVNLQDEYRITFLVGRSKHQGSLIPDFSSF